MIKKMNNTIYVLLTVFLIGIYGWLWLKKDILMAKLTLVVLITIIVIYGKKYFNLLNLKKSVCDTRNWYQIGSVAFFLLLFLLCAIFSKMNVGLSISIKIYFITGFIFIMLTLLVFYYLKKYRNNMINNKVLDMGAVAIVIIASISRIPMFTNIQMWDGIIYYGTLQEACENFNFTLESVWNYFRLAGHFTFAYTFFMSMGEFLLPGEMLGVQLVMLIMTTIALLCVYKMLQLYWCKMSKIQAFIVATLVSFIPNFYGMFSNINIDYFLVIFFIYLIYADYKRWEIMRFFWMFCVALTKETGLFIIAGYSIAYIFLRWKKSENLKRKERFSDLLGDNLVKSVIISMIALCCFVLRQGSLFIWMGIGEKSFLELMQNYINAANGENLVLFVLSFIIHKIVQLFTMNFTWIPTLIILSVGIKLWKEKKKIKLQGMTGVLGGLIIFLLFSIFSTIIISSIVSRYAIFSMVFIWIVAIVIMFNEYGQSFEQRKQMLAISILTVLLFIQSYIYIDPITNLWFDRLDTGNGMMVSGEKDYNNYGDTFVNNYYYRYIEELIDEMLREIDYSEECQIVMPYKREYMCITGNVTYSVGWDVQNKCRTMSKSPNKKIIPINQIELFNIEELDKSAIKSKAIAYFMPYIECDQEEIFSKLEKYYKVGEKHTITNWGGSISYYELEYKKKTL